MIRNNTVYSENGKRLSKKYKTKRQAKKRLQQIEYFKHLDSFGHVGK